MLPKILNSLQEREDLGFRARGSGILHIVFVY